MNSTILRTLPTFSCHMLALTVLVGLSSGCGGGSALPTTPTPPGPGPGPSPTNIPPSAEFTVLRSLLLSGQTTAIALTNLVDPDSASVTVRINWGNGEITTSDLAPSATGAEIESPRVITVCDPAAPPETFTVSVSLQGVGDATASNAEVVGTNTYEVASGTGIEIFNADFEDYLGDNAWTDGGLPNTDIAGASSFTVCNTTALTGFLPTSGKLVTGPDAGGCTSNVDSYGAVVRNNAVSPKIDLTAACDAVLVFDEFANSRDFTSFRVRLSEDGTTWTSLSDFSYPIGTAYPVTNIGHAVPIPADFLGKEVFLNFQYEDREALWLFTPGEVAGWAVDNVRVFALLGS